MVPGFSYTRPKTLQEAISRLASGRASAYAGGTDLLGCLRDGVFATGEVVSISGLPELKGVSPAADGGLRIGALVTLSEIAGNAEVRRRYPALAQGAAEAASPQLRNQGTLGGNLCQKPRCWYYRGEFHCLRKGGDRCYAVAGQNQYHCILGGEGCFIVHPSDTAPALTVYDAAVEIAGPAGRRTVPVETFFVPPSRSVTRETVLEAGEIVTGVVLPRPPEGLRSSYRKVRDRGAWDFAVAGVALALRISGGAATHARIVLAGAAPVPWRSREAEQVLVGNPVEPGTVRKAAEAALKTATPLQHNGYKVALFKGLLEQELTALMGKG